MDQATRVAAVPAFAQLDMTSRAALIADVRTDVEPTLAAYRSQDSITFPMFANVVVASV